MWFTSCFTAFTFSVVVSSILAGSLLFLLKLHFESLF